VVTQKRVCERLARHIVEHEFAEKNVDASPRQCREQRVAGMGCRHNVVALALQYASTGGPQVRISRHQQHSRPYLSPSHGWPVHATSFNTFHDRSTREDEANDGGGMLPVVARQMPRRFQRVSARLGGIARSRGYGIGKG
jgi:hypothetical protein